MKRVMVCLAIGFIVVSVGFPAVGAEKQPGGERMFNPQPEPPGEPWKLSIQQDLNLFNQEINAAKGKLAGAKPGADLAVITVTRSHANMMNLLRSLQAKVKNLQETRGSEKGIIIVCNKIAPKLDSLDVSLKNFRKATEQNNISAAQALLPEISGAVNGIGALLGEYR